MRTKILIPLKNGESILEEVVIIKTADPRITGKIFELDGKYIVKDDNKLKFFNRLSEAIQYCQPDLKGFV